MRRHVASCAVQVSLHLLLVCFSDVDVQAGIQGAHQENTCLSSYGDTCLMNVRLSGIASAAERLLACII